jgi:hypothetical protein
MISQDPKTTTKSALAKMQREFGDQLLCASMEAEARSDDSRA